MGHLEIVRLFLERCIPVENDLPAELVVVNHAFQTACVNGHAEIAHLFLELPLERGVHFAAHDNEALWYACVAGHTEIIRSICRWKEE